MSFGGPDEKAFALWLVGTKNYSLVMSSLRTSSCLAQYVYDPAIMSLQFLVFPNIQNILVKVYTS